MVERAPRRTLHHTTRGPARHTRRVTATDDDFRCSGASVRETEPMAGSAPTETEWLLVEHAGPWGHRALEESRLPEPVRTHLAGLDLRVQLIRRHGGESGPGVRVFHVVLGTAPQVRTAVLDDAAGLLGPIAWESYDGPLWLVCTNGRRDLCCAELGRPVTAALVARWPEATWETTHLGGHRFAATLLALPSGIALGRLDPSSAVAAVAELEAGRLPRGAVRGRVGLPGAAQVAELHLRADLELDALDAVAVSSVDGGRVSLEARGTTYVVEVVRTMSEPLRQSCADRRTKPAPVYAVTGRGT